MLHDALSSVPETRRSDAIVGNLPVARIVRLKDGRRVVLRNSSAADRESIQQFVRGLSIQSRRNRFFSPVCELSSDQLDRVTSSPAAGGLALVAETVDGAGPRIVALSQYVVCEPFDAEFAVVVDDAWQRQGLGSEMLGVLAEHSARSGLASFTGLVLADNWPMLTLLSGLECEFSRDGDPDVVRAVKRFDIHEGSGARPIETLNRSKPCEPAVLRDAGLKHVDNVMN